MRFELTGLPPSCFQVWVRASEELARLRTEFDGELDLGGPTLAAEFIRRGLVDEYRPVVHPVVLGAGTPFLPPLTTPLQLRLKESKRFASGAVYLAYSAG